jgi:hypothetical protein
MLPAQEQVLRVRRNGETGFFETEIFRVHAALAMSCPEPATARLPHATLLEAMSIHPQNIREKMLHLHPLSCAAETGSAKPR